MPSDLMDYLLDDAPAKASPQSDEYWKVMIVDDDLAVHEATKFSLRGFSFLDRPIQWLSAYSSREAKLLLERERDIALLFLDVVMEEEDAGLAFARWYRDMNINPSTRIILRTGQPGQAPEREIILDYDLHDYKTKTELTSDRLFTTTVSALRSFHDMERLEKTRAGLESIVDSTATILKMQTIQEYARAVLMQIESIPDISSSGLVCVRRARQNGWSVLAETGMVTGSHEEIFRILQENQGQSQTIGPGFLVRMLAQGEDTRFALYIESDTPLSDIQIRMLLMFCNNVSVGLSNIRLYSSLLRANRVTVMSLAQVTESRDHNTGEHVFRIAGATEMLGRRMLDEGLYPNVLTRELVDELGLSSTLHDIGKVTVRDAVLLKPGRLTPEEFAEVKLHTVMGADVLGSVLHATGEKVRYLEMGRKIALYHHERWDGNGYPHGLAGEDIPIEARITAIVDVFDALTHERCYKPAYEVKEAKDIIAEGRGTQFDPLITDVFLDMAEAVLAAPFELKRQDFFS